MHRVEWALRVMSLATHVLSEFGRRIENTFTEGGIMQGLRLGVAATLAIGWLVTATHVGLAEDDHQHRRRGVAKHRIGIQIYSPMGVRVTDHQDQYRYVVPATGRYGAFYSHDNANYYTPPVARVIGQQTPPVPFALGTFLA